MEARQIAVALKTTSVRKMAKILHMHAIPPKLSINALVEQFLIEATPRAPTDLAIHSGSNGTNLSWTDPGAGKFFRATKFNWNFWDSTSSNPGAELDDGNHIEATSVHTSATTSAGHSFSLFVQAFNKYEGMVLVSEPVSTSTISIPVPHQPGNGIEGGGGGSPSRSERTRDDRRHGVSRRSRRHRSARARARAAKRGARRSHQPSIPR